MQVSSSIPTITWPPVLLENAIISFRNFSCLLGISLEFYILGFTKKRFTNHLITCLPSNLLFSKLFLLALFSNTNSRNSFVISLLMTRIISNDCKSIEYNTFLHHSQTTSGLQPRSCPLEYHTFLHHSQTTCRRTWSTRKAWVPYIFTSFSNSVVLITFNVYAWVPYIFTSFSNSSYFLYNVCCAWVPYIFTSFSNGLSAQREHPSAWVPYIFTSFSNGKR